MPALTLRHADPERDAAACAAIYAPSVEGSAISFEEVAPDAAEFAARIETTTRTHPWLVLDDGESAVAFAYASPHRARAAYRWAAEVGIYVGAGTAARAPGAACTRRCSSSCAARTCGPRAPASRCPTTRASALHRALGFEDVGVYRAIGWKNGAWHDVVWLQLALRPGDDGPPPELLGPQRLRDDF